MQRTVRRVAAASPSVFGSDDASRTAYRSSRFNALMQVDQRSSGLVTPVQHAAVAPPVPVERRRWAEAFVSGRPRWPLAALADAACAFVCYLGANQLRFSQQQLSEFAPYVWEMLPWVIGSQLTVLALARVYTSTGERSAWFMRVLVAAIVGTAGAAGVIALRWHLQGASRVAFAADAALFALMTLGWRAVWSLSVKPPVASADALDDLIDLNEQFDTPGAVLTSVFRYRELLKNLVLKDLKLKYRGSVFGFLWSLANPLLMIVVYTVAFTFILRIRASGFVFYVMLGQLSWTFFANSAGMSTGALIDNAGLLKSVSFPTAILPIGTVLFNLAQYLLTAAVFIPAMLIWYRVPLVPPMLLYPVFLALQCVFTIGIALMLASATVFFRDVRHLLEVTLAVLFWTTPIVYEMQNVPESLRVVMLMSPVSPFLVAYQELFFYRQWPPLTVCFLAVVYAFGALVLGASMFLRLERRFTEQL
jgi:ABC-2 type transport system permease protein